MSEEKNASAVEPQEEQAKKSKLREFLEFIAPIVIAMVLKHCVFANAVIPTGSMLDTIQQGDRVIASRLAYTFDDPERFDIAIFKYPDNEKEYFVKRVIGLPGEKVDILNGTVYITGADGKTLELRDDFVSQENKDNYSGSFVVPEDCYFVMGDNRDNSVDSRYWVTTNYVSRDKFIGKVMFRYYPFKTAGKLE